MVTPFNDDASKKQPLRKHMLVHMFCGGVVFFIAIHCILRFLYFLNLPVVVEYYSEMQTYTDPSDLKTFLLSWAYAILLAPVLEEILFRRLLLPFFLRWLHAAIAILLQAVVFALIHWSFVQSTYALLMGLLMGYVYYKYRRISYCILFHVTVNLCNLPYLFISGSLS